MELLDTLERRLGINEESRKVLEILLDIAVRNPDKVLRLERLHDRVNGLERRLEDRTEVWSPSWRTRTPGSSSPR